MTTAESSLKWKPKIGEVITVHLPQEIVRAVVESYIDDDHLKARLSVQPPMAKSHSYRFRQLVKLHRERAQPMGDKWVAEDK